MEILWVQISTFYCIETPKKIFFLSLFFLKFDFKCCKNYFVWSKMILSINTIVGVGLFFFTQSNIR